MPRTWKIITRTAYRGETIIAFTAIAVFDSHRELISKHEAAASIFCSPPWNNAK
jgi:hypothetical protein